MNETESGAEFCYNRVPYESHAVPHTHPAHLAALGKFFGMHPPDIRKCRVLELGCGDGGNLIPMAWDLPESEFAGFDLSDQAIARGRHMADQMGVRNLNMAVRDILDIGEDMGKFDYILAHGVYSWVPENVREKMLQIFRDCLSENGIVYVSYNAYPGGHLNRIVNDAMRFHTASVSSPEQKNIQAVAILRFLAQAAESGDVYGAVLRDQLEHLSKIRHVLVSNYLFHDRIAEINQPFYFSEFMTDAHRHGLRFLAEADFSEMQDFFLKPEIVEMLRRLAGNSIIAKEQLLDFIKGRKFRKTLLCHEHISLNRQIHPEVMKNFFFSGRIRCMDAEENPVGKERDTGELIRMPGLRFRSEGEKALLVTEELLPRLALVHLSRIWPRRMGFEEIVTLGQEYGVAVTDREISALCEVLQSGFAVNMIQIHVWKPEVASAPSAFPRAAGPARCQITHGHKNVCNLLHQTVDLEDTYGLILLSLMDGTRDLNFVRREALNLIRKQGISLKGKPPDEKSDEIIYAEIDEEIANCIRYGLLAA